ncbi:ANTAR domain-containing response regulator [Rhodopila sp.]|uniref:ANTAR domain-containing response regulator n=1 Tax=Rhodopila sp. TaxID=2480087 RepID=UPI003D132F7F
MAIEILRDLRGLRIEVMHPPDAEGISLVEHLHRIGCITSTVWPFPEEFAPTSDLIVLAVDHDSREPLRRLLRGQARKLPTVIGIVEYENPSILQLVLEIGAHAVIERPVRPFGLLTQLAIARSLWLRQQETDSRVCKLERKLAGIQKIQRARLILIASQGLSEEDAYRTIRRQAMSKRIPMEEMAVAIIHAHDQESGQARMP